MSVCVSGCLPAYHLTQRVAEDVRGSSGIGRGKSIGLAEGILLLAEVVECPKAELIVIHTELDMKRVHHFVEIQIEPLSLTGRSRQQNE